jgi:cell division initiation protein
MPITPIDIRKKKFSTHLRGIDAQEVKNFLELVANEMEALRKERSLLAEKVDDLSARLEGYSKTERLLKDTLVTAQQASTDMKETTQKEAENILEKARLEAQAIIQKTEEVNKKLRTEINELSIKKRAFFGELRGVIQSYLSMLDHWESNIDEEEEKKNEGEDRRKR